MLTFDVMVNDVVRVQVLQAPQDLFGHPDDFELSHWSAAVQFLQHRATFASLHEQVDALVPEQNAVQLCDVLMAKAGLKLYISSFEVLHGDLAREIRHMIKNSPPFWETCSSYFLE